DQRRDGFGEATVVKRGPAFGARGLALSFQDSSRQGFSRQPDIRHASLLGLGCNTSEHFEDLAPVAFGVVDSAHLVATLPITIEMAMLQFNACAIGTIDIEAHLDFSLERWVILPIGVDIPREDQARVWFPSEHAAPLTDAPIIAALVPAASYVRLNDCVNCVGFANFVICERPPGTHLFGEHSPRYCLRRLNAHDFPHAIRIESGDPYAFCLH